MASRSTSFIVTELKPDVFVQVSMDDGYQGKETLLLRQIIKVVGTAEADADAGFLPEQGIVVPAVCDNRRSVLITHNVQGTGDLSSVQCQFHHRRHLAYG